PARCRFASRGPGQSALLRVAQARRDQTDARPGRGRHVGSGTRVDHSLDHVDVLIVGAGLSGIGAAYHLQAKCPEKSYAILEARSRSGGTWDLFRYPGIRSDSDMYTLGYSFRPWENPKAIADGESILAYVRDTAERNGINQNI